MYSEKVNALYKEMCEVLNSVETPIMVSEEDSFEVDWVSDGQGVGMEDLLCCIDDDGNVCVAGEWTDDEDEWSFVCPNEIDLESLGMIADYVLKVQGKKERNFVVAIREIVTTLNCLFRDSNKDLVFDEGVEMQFLDDNGDLVTNYAIGVKNGCVVYVVHYHDSVEIETVSPELIFVNNLADVADAALERELGPEE